MAAEIGAFALCWAMMFALGLVFIPSYALYKNKQQLLSSTNYYVYGLFVSIVSAYLCLTYSFAISDFSVIYVLKNSSLDLPWFYKICAVWGGHEGSMLLWALILSFWTLAVSLFSKDLDIKFRARVLVVLGFITFGFILFILATSNPFARQFQLLETTGQDLNPLLQDPGFLFHPPMLYMGYVGFSVAFAFAIAALWSGEIKSEWTAWARPWTLIAWCCLTAGITLGSWWAYRELGWGGFWFWDPVENASFMPWLVGTALIHSLIMSEKRGQFVAWTLLLSIFGFSLSLIGTFLVRSGVLTSVHAFAVDPMRGMYILCFLLIVIGGSLLIFSLRAHKLYLHDKPQLVSRESGILLNNVFLVVAMLTVLMGTVYPILIDALGLGKISVGAPYFNIVFVYLMLPMLFCMGVGIHAKWGRDSILNLYHKLGYTLLISLTLPWILVTTYFNQTSILVYLSLAMASWVTLSTLQGMLTRVKQSGIKCLKLGYLGMIVAHIGVACLLLGVAVSNGFGITHDVRLSAGDVTKLAKYQVKFVEENNLRGPNYHGVRATFSIKSADFSKNIYPEKRIYNVTNMAMTDAAIDVGVFRDIYIALGEPLSDTSWSVRMYYKPLVRFIWFGGFIILSGGILALLSLIKIRRRYKVTAANDSVMI